MEELYLPHHTRFIDRERNKTYQGPGKFEVEDDAVEHYLERRWEWPDEEDEEDETTESEAGDPETNDDEAEEVGEIDDVETPEANPQEEYTRQELEEMSYEQLRTMASKSEREDVNGRSRKQDIVDAFASGDAEDE